MKLQELLKRTDTPKYVIPSGAIQIHPVWYDRQKFFVLDDYLVSSSVSGYGLIMVKR